MWTLINKPEPPLPLMLMIKFPSISVQPLYSFRDATESMGSFSVLQTIQQQKIKTIIFISSVIEFLSIVLEAEALNPQIYCFCLFLTFPTRWVWQSKNVIIERESCQLKVIQNSFQHFPRLRISWVIITTLYQLMLQSWCQKTAQSLVKMLSSFLWHNTLP